jgi:protein O-mannosyl-transferase
MRLFSGVPGRTGAAAAGPALANYSILALLVAVVYAVTLNHGFVWDDNLIIVQNPLLEKLANIPRMFLSEDTAIGSTGYYRPVTYLSFALDRALWGQNPAGFHLSNLLLHAGAVLLFYAASLEMFGRERLAFVAALVFGLHPVAGETVNFLSGGRNTLLAACFGLLALLCHLRGKQVAALASFGVAIFSKEFALLLPVVFLVHDYRTRQGKLRPGRYLPYLVLIVLYLTLRSFAVRSANFLAAMKLSDLLTAPYLVVRYLVNLVAPFQLKVFYDLEPSTLASLLCLGLITLLAVAAYLARKHQEVLLAAGWFLLFLLPVINIIPLQQAALMADRYAYFSLMGFAWAVGALCSRWQGRAATAALIGLCLVYGGIDLWRNRAWTDEMNFYTQMTLDAPEQFDGYQNLGMLHYRKGEIDRALPHLKTAINKDDISPMFLIGSASVFWKEGHLDSAEQALLKALEMGPGNPEPYLMLITLYERSGHQSLARSYREKAEATFRGVDQRIQARMVSLCREGEAYLAAKLFVPAENVFWQALMIHPEYVPALVGMGNLSAGRGDLAGASSYLNQAIAVDPGYRRAHDSLAKVYRRQGRGAEAEAEERMVRGN